MSRHGSNLSRSVDIDAPPERVWAVMVDVTRWPEWTPSVTQIRRLDAGPLAVGARARIHQPRLLPAVWEVSDFLEGRRFTWVTSSPGVRVSASHVIEPTTDGSRVVLSLHFSGFLGRFIASWTSKLNSRYLALEADGIKKRSEHPDFGIRGRRDDRQTPASPWRVRMPGRRP